jgi:hypothetical protein
MSVTNLKNMKKQKHKVIIVYSQRQKQSEMNSHTWNQKGKKLQK